MQPSTPAPTPTPVPETPPQTPIPSPATETSTPPEPVVSPAPRPQVSDELLEEIRQQPPLVDEPRKKRSRLWRWLGVVGGVLLLCVLCAAAAGYAWYNDQLSSPEPDSTDTARVVVAEGSTSSDVATELVEQGVIKNQFAFEMYYRFHHTTGLKSGVYVLERSSSVQEIVDELEAGKSDEFMLTFLPGGTIDDARKVLLEAGYATEEIEAAMTRQYDHPLLADKPAEADIEGYIYGDTYSFLTGSTVEQIFERIFDHMYEDVQAEGLVEAYAARDMTLYEGITFASIVQAEESDAEDMAHVSQVFHKRLAIDMPLGSDVTFIYGARKLGVAPTVDLDSPYNTRIVKGLPPGPVSNPGYDALVAGANPTDTDDLYFVAGDDGTTYFSKTNEEHERLTREHCHTNCILPSE